MKIQTPAIADLQQALTSLKKEIDEDYVDYDDHVPHIDVTLACSEKGYALQTGDNSYSGPAYHHRFWGVGRLYKTTNCTELAKDLIGQCKDGASY